MNILFDETLLNTTIDNRLDGVGVADYTNIFLKNQSNTVTGTTVFQGNVQTEFANISDWHFNGNSLSYNGTGIGIIQATSAATEIQVGTNFDFLNNTIQNFRLDVQNNQTCIGVSENYTGKFWQNSNDEGRLSVCNPGIGGNGIDRVAYMRDLIGIGGASYGDFLTGNTASLFDGSAPGLSLTNSNATAETSFFVNLNDDGDSGGFQVFAVGLSNTNFLTPAGSTVVLLDSAAGSYIGNSLGGYIEHNIGSGGNLNATAQQRINVDNITTNVESFFNANITILGDSTNVTQDLWIGGCRIYDNGSAVIEDCSH